MKWKFEHEEIGSPYHSSIDYYALCITIFSIVSVTQPDLRGPLMISSTQALPERNAWLMRSATYASVIVACVLSTIKGIAYLLTDSVALLSTLIDSLVDAAASLINLLAVALYCVNFWLRMHRPPGENLPIILSVIGVVFITISGWLGGELVYVRGVAVRQPPDESI